MFTRRMLCVLWLPGRYWLDSPASSIDSSRACALSIFLPTHWSTQLVHSPTCPSSKAEPHCCQIHPNPSRLIAVEWDPENSLTTVQAHLGSSGQILTSRQSNAFAATIHQRCEEGERCKGEEPSYTDQPTPVIRRSIIIHSNHLASVSPNKKFRCRTQPSLVTNLVTNLSPNLVTNLMNHQIW